MDDGAAGEAVHHGGRDGVALQALHPYGAGGGYVNFLDADDQSGIEDNYGGNYARLASIKAKYDPGNLFHINQNIKPAG
ncbi:BBE domain-containing protein [Pseudarthrobacter sp. NPDC092184]|uniref:BBE domain-containing protein n=1 Tax=unclassified Pseudarthrobacter TaxID=2647000 RepID=UPI0032EEC7FE